LPSPKALLLLGQWPEVGLFVGKELQHGLPLCRLGSLRQYLAVVSKILFVNETIHSKPLAALGFI
jgi:hypothetical protein